MLHLFDKVYVCLEYLLDASKKRIIVSDRKDLKSEYGLQPIKHHVEKFEDLIGEKGIYPEWEDFLSSLENENKFRIYVNIDSFNKFFVYWIKTIFPNITKNLAFCIYNCYVQRFKIHFPSIVLNTSFLDYRKENLLNFKLLSKEDFYLLFEKSKPWKNESRRKLWVEKNVEGFSLEWHLANYFIDKNHLKVFKEKYLHILCKALWVEVSEWYQYITKYFMKKEVQKELGLKINWDDENWREIFKSHPKLYWMFDDDLNYISKNPFYFLAHVDKALEVGQLLKTFWFKDIPIDDKIRLLDKDYFESDHAQYTFKSLEILLQNKDNLTEKEFAEFIEKDFGRESVSIIFDLLNHATKWNTILIQLIYELRNDNDVRLKELSFK